MYALSPQPQPIASRVSEAMPQIGPSSPARDTPVILTHIFSSGTAGGCYDPARMTKPAGEWRRTAAVTGAGSGIGRAFCIALAREGYDLILIDRSAEAISTLAVELCAEHKGITADLCAADLTLAKELETTAERLRGCGNLHTLVNAAGFGISGTFLDADFALQKNMIELHILATVALCRASLPGMVVRNTGGIINVASIAAFTRFPENSIYTASKMFLVAFTECLDLDLHKAGAGNIRVQALCPGQTRTPFVKTAALRGFDPSRIPSFMWMEPEQVVDLSLRALKKKSGTYIPMFRNRIFARVFGNRAVIRLLRVLRKFGLLEKCLELKNKRLKS